MSSVSTPTEGTAVLFRRVERHFGTVKGSRRRRLNIVAGEFFAMLGPSGSGKTTCLRLIAGFDQPTAGHIEISAKPLKAFRPIAARLTPSSRTTPFFRI